ncbi:MAG: KipI antagonist [Deltaproteobacteria bacterium CG_4_8_14_3_um_filter_45_9]|nr:MAG: KipI antagonist [Deltaproteobacteria bacterium CG03_land_8_20_14_0_80_45_14]PIX22647.1 MAG: KipI antagonist [Deltaproteobacteria bacterium CG_4_8_14_3_um_filter_45_9]
MEQVAAFEVSDPGILTTIQDLGRYGFSQFGVPPSGALDTFSLRVGNLLVGNREEEACLEVTLMGLKIKAMKEVVIAITGGDLSPALNGEPLEMWRTHLLLEGDAITFKKVKAGCRAYLAVSRGLVVPKIMGSCSTYLSGNFGGLEGRPLRRGDILYTLDIPSSLDKLGLRFPNDWIPSLEKEALLRIIPGPQDRHFTEKGVQTFCSSSYQVTPQCDRMGVRLEGPKIERRSDVEESIISEGLISGSIQVPGNGKPIIILTELVTGGYTKIATIISTDLPKVAQLKPGDQVRFKPISIEESHDLLKEQEDRLKNFKEILQQR